MWIHISLFLVPICIQKILKFLGHVGTMPKWLAWHGRFRCLRWWTDLKGLWGVVNPEPAFAFHVSSSVISIMWPLLFIKYPILVKVNITITHVLYCFMGFVCGWYCYNYHLDTTTPSPRIFATGGNGIALTQVVAGAHSSSGGNRFFGVSMRAAPQLVYVMENPKNWQKWMITMGLPPWFRRSPCRFKWPRRSDGN